MAKKRIYKTLFGIPLWIITGISIFLIISVLYDLFVGDKNIMRYTVLISSILILLLSIIMHLIPVDAVGKMAKRQLGG